MRLDITVHRGTLTSWLNNVFEISGNTINNNNNNYYYYVSNIFT